MAEGIGGVDPGEIAESFSSVEDQVIEAVQQASERLEIERHMRENPWMVLGIAAGAGFVLGGGLWPALKPLVKAAGRSALSPSNLLALLAALGAMRAGQAKEAPGPVEAAKPIAH
jgi:hypothetical protein